MSEAGTAQETLEAVLNELGTIVAETRRLSADIHNVVFGALAQDEGKPGEATCSLPLMEVAERNRCDAGLTRDRLRIVLNRLRSDCPTPPSA